MTHYTKRWRDGAHLNVQITFYNGKEWHRVYGLTSYGRRLDFTSVFRSTDQWLPRTFGSF